MSFAVHRFRVLLYYYSMVGPRAREFTTAAHRNGDGNNVRPTRHINPLTDELGDLCARRRLLARQIGTQCTSRVTFSESTERLYEAYNILLYSVRGRYVTCFWCGREPGIFYFFFALGLCHGKTNQLFFYTLLVVTVFTVGLTRHGSTIPLYTPTPAGPH